MSTKHRHIATEWQLRAAEKQVLEAIALILDEGNAPVFPNDLSNFQIVENDSCSWVYCDRPGWPQGYRFAIPYKVGDRIFFAEEWGSFLKSRSETQEYVWNSPDTMPKKLARFQYPIKSISILKMKDLKAIAGLTFGLRITKDGKDISVGDPEYLPEMQAQWESFFGWPWEDDRYVIVLDLRGGQNVDAILQEYLEE